MVNSVRYMGVSPQLELGSAGLVGSHLQRSTDLYGELPVDSWDNLIQVPDYRFMVARKPLDELDLLVSEADLLSGDPDEPDTLEQSRVRADECSELVELQLRAIAEKE